MFVEAMKLKHIHKIESPIGAFKNLGSLSPFPEQLNQILCDVNMYYEANFVIRTLYELNQAHKQIAAPLFFNPGSGTTGRWCLNDPLLQLPFFRMITKEFPSINTPVEFVEMCMLSSNMEQMNWALKR